MLDNDECIGIPCIEVEMSDTLEGWTVIIYFVFYDDSYKFRDAIIV